jgi:acyl-CoA synthetase (AMP-forming)/AMP-acid ligase II
MAIYMYIMDRAKDLIIRGGENISCSEVENCPYQLTEIAECALFGLPRSPTRDSGRPLYMSTPLPYARALAAEAEPELPLMNSLVPNRITAITAINAAAISGRCDGSCDGRSSESDRGVISGTDR